MVGISAGGGLTLDFTSGASIGGTISGGTVGSVLFIDSSGNLSQDNPNFIYSSNTLKVPILNITSAAIARLALSANGTNTLYASSGGNNLVFSGPANTTAVSTGLIQFNNISAFSTNSSLQSVFLALTPTINSSGTGGNTDLLINRTQTGTGSGNQYLIDLQVASSSKFNVDNTGNITMGTSNAGIIKDSGSNNRFGFGAITNSYNALGGASANINHLFGSVTQTQSSGVGTGVDIAFTLNQTSTAGFTDLLINRTQTAVGSGLQSFIDCQVASASLYTIANSGKQTKYAGVTAVGWGSPAIYGAGRSTAQTAAVASVAAYTVGAADGSFYVSCNVLVTTATTHVFSVTCAYTDEGNTARTLTLNFTTSAGTIGTSVTNANGAVPYVGIPVGIRCKAATTITIATTGTFTSVVYNVEGFISQLS